MGTCLRYIGDTDEVVIGDVSFTPGGDPQEVPDQDARRVLRRPGADEEWEVVGSSVEEVEETEETEDDEKLPQDGGSEVVPGSEQDPDENPEVRQWFNE